MFSLLSDGSVAKIISASEPSLDSENNTLTSHKKTFNMNINIEIESWFVDCKTIVSLSGYGSVAEIISATES